MPIQYRCPECRRLLSISSRKAGEMLPCPACGHWSRVPVVAKAPEAPPKPAKPPAAPTPDEVKEILKKLDGSIHLKDQSIPPGGFRKPPRRTPERVFFTSNPTPETFAQPESEPPAGAPEGTQPLGEPAPRLKGLASFAQQLSTTQPESQPPEPQKTPENPGKTTTGKKSAEKLPEQPAAEKPASEKPEVEKTKIEKTSTEKSKSTPAVAPPKAVEPANPERPAKPERREEKPRATPAVPPDVAAEHKALEAASPRKSLQRAVFISLSDLDPQEVPEDDFSLNASIALPEDYAPRYVEDAPPNVGEASFAEASQSEVAHSPPNFPAEPPEPPRKRTEPKQASAAKAPEIPKPLPPQKPIESRPPGNNRNFQEDSVVSLHDDLEIKQYPSRVISFDNDDSFSVDLPLVATGPASIFDEPEPGSSNQNVTPGGDEVSRDIVAALPDEEGPENRQTYIPPDFILEEDRELSIDGVVRLSEDPPAEEDGEDWFVAAAGTLPAGGPASIFDTPAGVLAQAAHQTSPEELSLDGVTALPDEGGTGLQFDAWMPPGTNTFLQDAAHAALPTADDDFLQSEVAAAPAPSIFDEPIATSTQGHDLVEYSMDGVVALPEEDGSFLPPEAPAGAVTPSIFDETFSTPADAAAKAADETPEYSMDGVVALPEADGSFLPPEAPAGAVTPSIFDETFSTPADAAAKAADETPEYSMDGVVALPEADWGFLPTGVPAGAVTPSIFDETFSTPAKAAEEAPEYSMDGVIALPEEDGSFLPLEAPAGAVTPSIFDETFSTPAKAADESPEYSMDGVVALPEADGSFLPPEAPAGAVKPSIFEELFPVPAASAANSGDVGEYSLDGVVALPEADGSFLPPAAPAGAVAPSIFDETFAAPAASTDPAATLDDQGDPPEYSLDGVVALPEADGSFLPANAPAVVPSIFDETFAVPSFNAALEAPKRELSAAVSTEDQNAFSLSASKAPAVDDQEYSLDGIVVFPEEPGFDGADQHAHEDHEVSLDGIVVFSEDEPENTGDRPVVPESLTSIFDEAPDNRLDRGPFNDASLEGAAEGEPHPTLFEFQDVDRGLESRGKNICPLPANPSEVPPDAVSLPTVSVDSPKPAATGPVAQASDVIDQTPARITDSCEDIPLDAVVDEGAQPPPGRVPGESDFSMDEAVLLPEAACVDPEKSKPVDQTDLEWSVFQKHGLRGGLHPKAPDTTELQTPLNDLLNRITTGTGSVEDLSLVSPSLDNSEQSLDEGRNGGSIDLSLGNLVVMPEEAAGDQANLPPGPDVSQDSNADTDGSQDTGVALDELDYSTAYSTAEPLKPRAPIQPVNPENPLALGGPVRPEDTAVLSRNSGIGSVEDLSMFMDATADNSVDDDDLSMAYPQVVESGSGPAAEFEDTSLVSMDRGSSEGANESLISISDLNLVGFVSTPDDVAADLAMAPMDVSQNSDMGEEDSSQDSGVSLDDLESSNAPGTSNPPASPAGKKSDSGTSSTGKPAEPIDVSLYTSEDATRGLPAGDKPVLAPVAPSPRAPNAPDRTNFARQSGIGSVEDLSLFVSQDVTRELPDGTLLVDVAPDVTQNRPHRSGIGSVEDLSFFADDAVVPQGALPAGDVSLYTSEDATRGLPADAGPLGSLPQKVAGVPAEAKRSGSGDASKPGRTTDSKVIPPAVPPKRSQEHFPEPPPSPKQSGPSSASRSSSENQNPPQSAPANGPKKPVGVESNGSTTQTSPLTEKARVGTGSVEDLNLDREVVLPDEVAADLPGLEANSGQSGKESFDFMELPPDKFGKAGSLFDMSEQHPAPKSSQTSSGFLEDSVPSLPSPVQDFGEGALRVGGSSHPSILGGAVRGVSVWDTVARVTPDANNRETPPPELAIRPRKIVSDEMDLTPMVDMTFLLLIFFMVTASFSIQKSVDYPAPAPDKKGAAPTVVAQEEIEATSIMVRIDANNAIMVDDVLVRDKSLLVDALRKAMKAGHRDVVIMSDSATHFETTMFVVDAAKEVNANKIRQVSSEAE